MIYFGFTIHRLRPLYYQTWSELAMQTVEPRIDWLCRKYQIRNMESDDLAQELRLHLWTKLQHYDPSRFAFSTWARHVLKNRILDLYRKTQKKNKNMLDAEGRVVLSWYFSDKEFDIEQV